MAVTLAELAKQEKQPLRKMIFAMLLRKSDLIGVIPFEPAESFESELTRWKELPTVSWRNLNEGYTPSEGKREKITETLYILGGDIEVDRQMLKVKNLLEPIKLTESKMKTAALAYEFNYQFINGDLAVNPKAIEGLKKRVANLPARQTIYATALSSDTVLPVLKDATNANRFLDQLSRLHTLVEGKPTHYFMNSTTLWGVEAMLRRAGQLNTVKDAFEREFTTFKGAMLVDVGVKADQATEVITNTEVAGDAGEDSTSIYAVHMELGVGCHGIQLSTPDIYDPLKGGEKESGPQTLLRIDWAWGLANWSNYSIARLYNFAMVYA